MEQLSIPLAEGRLPQVSTTEVGNDDSVIEAARTFAGTLPHTREPYAKRNWGGIGHSLCSYQGKLKPGIAYFLVNTFTRPGERVLDPMSGVGTIPFEARRLGRVGIGTDLSPVAASVSAAKLQRLDESRINSAIAELENIVAEADESVLDETEVDWGLNGDVRAYFEEQTLIEVVAARQHYLGRRAQGLTSEEHFLFTALLHILHGNRPYALSRTSHPITPLKPRGDFIYRPVMEALRERLRRILPYFLQLQADVPEGYAEMRALEDLHLSDAADALITSPPFISSLRFWSANWMRMWFAGWGRQDFTDRPKDFLESRQKNNMAVYEDFALSAARNIRPEGLLIMHLGVTAQRDMGEEIAGHLAGHFRVLCQVSEDVTRTESHGLTDKGRTLHHAYLFARRLSP